jgi:hypothetical protein
MSQPGEKENRLECPACKAPNLPENRFCSQCGTILDVSLSPLGQALLANVSEQVVAQMAEEIERRNQALGRRLTLWLGFPALIVLSAAVFFVAQSHYYARQLEFAQRTVSARLQQLQAAGQKLEEERVKVEADYLQQRQKPGGGADVKLESALHEEIRTALEGQLKDKDLVVTQIAEEAFSRTLDWMKLVGFIVGIPVAIFLAALTMWGLKTTSNMKALAESVRLRAELTVRQTRGRTDAMIANLTRDANARVVEFAQLIENMKQDVRKLANRVERIEQKVVIESEEPLNEEEEKKLESLGSFRDYLKKLGFQPKTTEIRVQVGGARVRGTVAFYDQNVNRMYVEREYIGDADIFSREYSHHALAEHFEQLSDVYRCIESGLADYFACSFKNDPLFAQETARIMRTTRPELSAGADEWARKLADPQHPHLRNLSNSRKFSQTVTNTVIPQVEGEAWGGAFWELRGLLGPDSSDPAIARVDRLLYSAWTSLQPADMDDRGEKFVRQLLAISDQGTADLIRKVFEQRGLKL